MTLIRNIANQYRSRAGIEDIADLGVVAQGRMGHSICTVSTGIECWRGTYFVWILVEQRKGRAGGYTRVIKWPYSQSCYRDLDGVLADLQFLENITTATLLPDHRGWFARALDRLLTRRCIGVYRFTSPLDDTEAGAIEVSAEVSVWNNQLELSLTESRRSHGFILAQLPLSSCAAIRQALATIPAAQCH